MGLAIPILAIIFSFVLVSQIIASKTKLAEQAQDSTALDELKKQLKEMEDGQKLLANKYVELEKRIKNMETIILDSRFEEETTAGEKINLKREMEQLKKLIINMKS